MGITGQIGFFDKPKGNNKKKVRFIKDVTDLNYKFVKGFTHEVYMEQPNNYILHVDGVFYGVFKENCEIEGE